MNDAGLDLRLRLDSLDGFRETAQAIDHGDQDGVQAAALQEDQLGSLYSICASNGSINSSGMSLERLGFWGLLKSIATVTKDFFQDHFMTSGTQKICQPP